MASVTWGENTLAEGLHDWERRAVHLLNYTLEFTLQRRKCAEDLSQVRRIVGHTLCADLAVFLGATSTGLLSINQLRLPWVTSVSPCSAQVLSSCRTKRFPTTVNSEWKLSVGAVKWWAKNGISKSSLICFLPRYQGALFVIRRRVVVTLQL
jgi:hypothetical protein